MLSHDPASNHPGCSSQENWRFAAAGCLATLSLCCMLPWAGAHELPEIQFQRATQEISSPRVNLPAIEFAGEIRKPAYARQVAGSEAGTAEAKRAETAVQLATHLMPLQQSEPQLLPAAGQTRRSKDRNPFRWNSQQDRMARLQQESPADRGVGEWTSKPITSLSTNIALPSGQLPSMVFPAESDHWQGACPCSCCPRGWAPLCYCYAATCFYHNPLYFEEINLERYGYGCTPCLQPAASAAHFFVRVPMLPYLLATDCPGECDYTLGHYRPGSCAPWRRHCVPLNAPGSLAQSGAIVGLVFLLP